jgi:hypothetical protein
MSGILDLEDWYNGHLGWLLQSDMAGVHIHLDELIDVHGMAPQDVVENAWLIYVRLAELSAPRVGQIKVGLQLDLTYPDGAPFGNYIELQAPNPSELADILGGAPPALHLVNRKADMLPRLDEFYRRPIEFRSLPTKSVVAVATYVVGRSSRDMANNIREYNRALVIASYSPLGDHAGN